MYGWQRYLSIEKEFAEVRQYVPYELMTTAYSEFFTRQVILLGAEIKAAMKQICKNVTPDEERGNIGFMKGILLGHFPKVVSWHCTIKTEEIVITPFEGWDKESLAWWDVFTNTKHNLVDEAATYEIALKMLAGYELLLLLVEATDPEREEFTTEGIGGSVWNEFEDGGKIRRYTCIDCPTLLVPDMEFGIGNGVNGLPGIAFYPENVLEKVRYGGAE